MILYPLYMNILTCPSEESFRKPSISSMKRAPTKRAAESYVMHAQLLLLYVPT